MMDISLVFEFTSSTLMSRTPLFIKTDAMMFIASFDSDENTTNGTGLNVSQLSSVKKQQYASL